jgi:phosphohistidine phosphatase SixA
LVLAIAFLAGSFLPGLATAAVADSAAAVADSTGASTAAATAPDTLGTSRKEIPRPDSTLVPRLRSGGYLIVLRHSITDHSVADRDQRGEEFSDRSTQRNLTKEGETQAARIGKAIAALGIPIDTVLSSPMWRCRDTAQIAFGHYRAMPELVRRGAEYRAKRVALLGTEPEEGKDVVLVTHQDLLIPIIEGLRRDQIQEGDALIVRPLGKGTFEIVAQVTPDDWERLEAAAKTAAVTKDGKAAKTAKPGKTAKK